MKTSIVITQVVMEGDPIAVTRANVMNALEVRETEVWTAARDLVYELFCSEPDENKRAKDIMFGAYTALQARVEGRYR